VFLVAFGILPALGALAQAASLPDVNLSPEAGSQEIDSATAASVDERCRGMQVGQIVVTGHNRTREQVVLQELLMSPGDPYDPELARETERNLRALPFLGSASVVPRLDPETGSVRVQISVTERFPWVGGVLPTFGGGKLEVDVVGGTGNLLGRGQILGARTFQSTEVQATYYLAFAEPRIAGSHWGAGFVVGTQGGVGPRNRVEVRRKLHSLSARWAFDASVFDEASERLFFENGSTISNYYERRRGIRASALRSFRKADRRLELGLRYTYRDDEHEQARDADGVIPLDKRRAVLMSHFTAERFEFVKDRYFDGMGPTEDLKLGLWGSVRAGGALEMLGSDRSYPKLGLSGGWFAGDPETGYIRLDGNVDTRIEAANLTNLAAVATARLYRRTGERGLLAWRAQFTLLHETEDPEQLLLDSPHALRGYPANAFDGEQRLVFNLEWRRPLLSLGPITAGTVVFVDGGAIWSERETLGSSPFMIGLGTGLRMGLTNVIGAPVVRLDLGYGARTKTWELSGGIGQRF
jgi:outer membrane protein assembly factor BamA